MVLPKKNEKNVIAKKKKMKYCMQAQDVGDTFLVKKKFISVKKEKILSVQKVFLTKMFIFPNNQIMAGLYNRLWYSHFYFFIHSL